jgi:hypothetical protein
MIASAEWFLEYVKQVHGTRAVGVGGVLRKYFKQLEEEPEDLVGHDDDATEETGGPSIYFRWYRPFKKYVMVQVTPTGVILRSLLNGYDNSG